MPRAFRLAAAAIALTAATAAIAHHGWEWTQDEESRLSGEIVSISLGNPHASLRLRNGEGVWDVDLAPPSATRRAGFVDGVASAGDRASFTGHRSRDAGDRTLKAETVTVGGRTFDVYPDREKTLSPAR